MHELTKRNDEWVKRDISQKGKYQLIRASRGNNMPEDSVQKIALNLLSQFAYENWFEKAYIRITNILPKQYTKKILTGTGLLLEIMSLTRILTLILNRCISPKTADVPNHGAYAMTYNVSMNLP